MNSDVKNLWIDALLSGKYKQGHECLKDHNGRYCCLGVLCDLAVKANVIPEPVTKEESYECPMTELTSYKLVTYFGSPIINHRGDIIKENHVVLPPEVTKWAGLNSYDPTTNEDGRTLSNLNDDGYTFQVLANIIKESL